MSRHAIILAALLTVVAMPLAAVEHPRPGNHPGDRPGNHPGDRPGTPHPVQPHVGGFWPRTVVTYNPWYSSYSYPYYSSYSYPYSYYGSGYPYYGYGGYTPIITIPTESLYGIGPIQRLMGVDNWNNPPVRVARPEVEPPVSSGRSQVEQSAARQNLDDAQAALSARYVEMGDVQFAAGKYVTAIERYRKAVAAAPRDAAGQMRMGFAFLATEQYDLAAKAMRRGLKLDPAWPASAFRLTDLYGDDDRAKASHLEVLAQEAEDHPENGDLLFLVGVFLHSDGQIERARLFFTRAAQLERVDRSPIDAFLKIEK